MELHWKFNLFGSNIMFMVESLEKMRQRERDMAEQLARLRSPRPAEPVTKPVTDVTPVTRRVTRRAKPAERMCHYCDVGNEAPLKAEQDDCCGSTKCRKRKQRAKEAKAKGRG